MLLELISVLDSPSRESELSSLLGTEFSSSAPDSCPSASLSSSSSESNSSPPSESRLVSELSSSLETCCLSLWSASSPSPTSSRSNEDKPSSPSEPRLEVSASDPELTSEPLSPSELPDEMTAIVESLSLRIYCLCLRKKFLTADLPRRLTSFFWLLQHQYILDLTWQSQEWCGFVMLCSGLTISQNKGFEKHEPTWHQLLVRLLMVFVQAPLLEQTW